MIRRLIITILTITILLLIPLIAMQFTKDVNWSPLDFLIMGTLLLSTGLMFNLILKRVKKTNHRILFYSIIVSLFFIIWGELAVGIFNTPFAGN